ncbi:MAG: cysteine desulfurase family protein [Rhizomicrobium sp.]|jgi:cysteine desulfurase
MAYLDHNATSPLRPEARAAMERAFAVTGNPSSVHLEGRVARNIVEDAREKVAALVGARPQNVIFTSGGTEANALALWGAVRGAAEAELRLTRMFVSAVEHSSVLQTAAAIAEHQPGIRVSAIEVSGNGAVERPALNQLLREGKGRALVAVMLANNETGVIQPLSEIVDLTTEYGALLNVDAIQACGKIAIDADCADYLSISAHKIGGPQGVGALIVKNDAPLAAQLVGGGQERGLRAGTENVIGIAGFGAAADAVRCEDTSAVLAIRDRFEAELRAQHGDVVVFGAAVPRLHNTSNFALPGVAAETAMMALDLDGVMVSSGSACSSGKVRPSHVLKAMGVPAELAVCALRVSFGWNSQPTDVDAVIASLNKVVARARSRQAA